MQPRWAKIKEIFQRALEVDASERSAYLDSACGSDVALRVEVESLLAQDERSGGLLRSDAETVRLETTVFSRGDVLAGRFEIRRLLGRGGMGEVYEAWDRDLRAAVALKTVRPELVGNRKVGDRFRREILLAHKVTHRNVCRIFDLVPDDSPSRNALIFTMELLEGETLAELLRRQKRLSADEAFPMIQQMTDGLAALHEQGVVHRDFKPGNVMLVPVEGKTAQVKITDFGLARATASERGTATLVSGSGDIVGTPKYMAPEQLTGGEISPATDVYALGLVIYEMVTGATPYSAESVANNAIQKTQQPPTPPSEHVPKLDPVWESTILQCLKAEPGQRPDSVLEVAAGLERKTGWWGALAARVRRFATLLLKKRRKQLAFAAVAAVILALFYVVPRFVPERGVSENMITRESGLPAEKHLALLPFKSIGGGPSGEAFCDGLVESVATRLTQLDLTSGKLFVVPFSEIRSENVTSARKAYEQFGVNLVISGSVDQSAGRVRITSNLVDPVTRRVIDGGTLDLGTEQLGSEQDLLLGKIVEMLGLAPASAAPTESIPSDAGTPDVHRLLMLARGYLQRYDKAGNIDRAIDTLQQAIHLDKGYYPAHARLAEAYLRKYARLSDPDLLSTARQYADQAVKLSPTYAISHAVLASILRETGDSKAAIDEYQQALTLGSSDADVYLELARTYRSTGQMDDAERTYRQAVKAQPLNWRVHQSLGVFYYRNGRYQEADQAFQRAIQITGKNHMLLRNLAGIYLAMGRFGDAADYAQKALEIQPAAKTYANLGTALFYQGLYDDAVEAFREAVSEKDSVYSNWGDLGDAYRWSRKDSNKAPGAYRTAIAEAQGVLKVNPRAPDVLALIALYRAKLGQCPAAFETVAKVPREASSGIGILFNRATINELCDHRAEAIDVLSQALDAGYPLGFVERDPELSMLREDPRYSEIVESRKQSNNGRSAVNGSGQNPSAGEPHRQPAGVVSNP